MTRTSAALLLAVALGACTAAPRAADGPDARPPATDPPPASEAAAPADLADGRHYAYLTAVDPGRSRVTVDVVRFFTGRAAQDAAREDGEEPFEVYVRNQNPMLRTLTLAAGAAITTRPGGREERGVTAAGLARYVAEPDGSTLLFRLRVTGGAVTEVHEQFLS